MRVYADTSFLVSLYVEDRHSAAADQMLRSRPRVWLTPLHIAEWNHAIAYLAFRRLLSNSEADQVYGELDRDRASGVWAAVDLPEDAFEICAGLARRYGPELGVRTLDSLHVACAIELKAEQFWTFDDRQRKLASAAGLVVR